MKVREESEREYRKLFPGSKVRGSRIHIPGCALLETMSSLCAFLSNTRATDTCLGGLSVPIADSTLEKDDRDEDRLY
jgi:hypothetical protein